LTRLYAIHIITQVLITQSVLQYTISMTIHNQSYNTQSVWQYTISLTIHNQYDNTSNDGISGF